MIDANDDDEPWGDSTESTRKINHQCIGIAFDTTVCQDLKMRDSIFFQPKISTSIQFISTRLSYNSSIEWCALTKFISRSRQSRGLNLPSHHLRTRACAIVAAAAIATRHPKNFDIAASAAAPAAEAAALAPLSAALHFEP